MRSMRIDLVTGRVGRWSDEKLMRLGAMFYREQWHRETWYNRKAYRVIFLELHTRGLAGEFMRRVRENEAIWA